LGSRLRAYVTAGVVLVGAGLIAGTPTVDRADGTRTQQVRLAASDQLQSVIDQLLQAQQQIAETNSEYPFITEFDKTTLPHYLQLLSSILFQNELGHLNDENSYDPMFFAPFGWNAPAAGAFELNATDASKQYALYYGGDEKTYELTVHPGPGSEDMTFRPQSPDFEALNAYDLSQFTPNPDGSYTIIMSPTEHSGNWIDTSGSLDTMIATSVGDWGLPHNTISVAPEAPTSFTLPVLSEDQISSVLSGIIPHLAPVNDAPVNHGVQQIINSLPDNTFTPIAPTSSDVGPALGQLQLTTFGHFVLDQDQALIVKVPEVDAPYGSMQAFTAWMANLPATTVQSSLNNFQSFASSDGYTYYVVSSQDPGVANWIDTNGDESGTLVMRWQRAAEAPTDNQPQVEVVNAADVKSEIGNLLPADTPIVTPEERAADLTERLLEYDYSRDQAYSSGWVTNHLEIDQIKNAMGADQFDKVLGGQTDVPSVLDRMTDSALVPDLGTVVNSVLADPQGALTASVENFPLLVQDIQLPMALAALRLDMLLGHAPEASTLDTIFSQTFSDPATSITAGFLNARDDLAVSLMNAGSYSPISSSDFTSAWDELVQFEQSVSQMLGAGLEYALGAPSAVASALDPGDIGSLGAELAGT
jgi:hypothetical protein